MSEKTLGQVAYEAARELREEWVSAWEKLSSTVRASWEAAAQAAVEAARDRDRGARPAWEATADERRYQRLRILGAAPFGSTQLAAGTVLRFQSLDAYLEADLQRHPSRGEYAESREGETATATATADERVAFEVWFARTWSKDTDSIHTADEVTAMREGEHYDSPVLSARWEGWQAARASQAAAPANPQGTFACPICGKETPHEHTSQEIAEHRSRKGA